MKLAGIALLLAGLPLEAASGNAFCVLFDLSQSAQNVRSAYLTDFQRVAEQLSEGDRLIGAGITADSLATGRFDMDITIEPFNRWTENKRQADERLKASRKTALKQAQRLLAGPATPTTDLLGAMQLAEKALNGNAMASAKHRYLILFSDMVEESGPYDFPRTNLTPARIGAIIAAERAAGHLPKLAGVTVWAAGAGGANRAKFLQIQDFWMRYFRAADAGLEPSRYGAALMDFPAPSP